MLEQDSSPKSKNSDLIGKNVEPKLETKEELDEFTKLEPIENEDTEIPDWLKQDSVSQNTSNYENLEVPVVEEQEKEEEVKPENTDNFAASIELEDK
ncbi:MAG: hypothetical protein LBU14_01985 [Candidatus Peribacteria bacterium]|nr:hypothetical protein [Candidatus Peribacteria bacterium]